MSKRAKAELIRGLMAQHPTMTVAEVESLAREYPERRRRVVVTPAGLDPATTPAAAEFRVTGTTAPAVRPAG